MCVCILLSYRAFSSLAVYSVIFLHCRQIWIPAALQSNADLKTSTDKTHFHLLSIFPFVRIACSLYLSHSPVYVCLCHDVVREFYCQENRYHKMPLFFLISMLRHCQALVCAFASKTIWIHRAFEHQFIENERKKCLEFWCCAVCLQKKETNDKINWNKWFESCDLFAFCYVARSRTVITPKWRRQINRRISNSPEDSGKEKKTRTARCVRPQEHIFLIFIFSSTRAIWQYFRFSSIKL